MDYIPVKGEPLSISDLEYPNGHLTVTMSSTIRASVRELSEASESISLIEASAVDVCN